MTTAVTMILVNIPECQENCIVVAEFQAGEGVWEITADKTDIVVHAETFETGVRGFAIEWRRSFGYTGVV